MVQTNTVEGPGREAGVIRIKGTNRGAGNGTRRQRPLVLPRSQAGRDARGGRVGAQRRLHRRDSDRGHQLPELRQSREAAHHVAVLADHRRHHQGLRGVGNADHRRQRQLLQRNAGRGYLSDAGDRNRRHPRGCTQGRRIRTSRKPAGRWCCYAAPSPATLPTSRPNSARPSTPRKCWASFGASRRPWSWSKEAALQKAIIQMIDEGLVESAKDCTEGGIAVTLAECGFANGIGAQVDLGFRRAGRRVRAVRRGRQPHCDFLRPEKCGANQTSSGKIRPLSGTDRNHGSRKAWKFGWTARCLRRQPLSDLKQGLGRVRWKRHCIRRPKSTLVPAQCNWRIQV